MFLYKKNLKKDLILSAKTLTHFKINQKHIWNKDIKKSIFCCSKIKMWTGTFWNHTHTRKESLVEHLFPEDGWSRMHSLFHIRFRPKDRLSGARKRACLTLVIRSQNLENHSILLYYKPAPFEFQISLVFGVTLTHTVEL